MSRLPAHPDFALELIHGLIDNDVDIGAAAKWTIR